MLEPPAVTRIMNAYRRILGYAFGLAAAVLVSTTALPAGASEDPAITGLLAASAQALDTAALSRLHTVDVSGSIDLFGIEGTARVTQDLRSGANATSVLAGPLSGDNGFDGRAAWNRDPFGVVWDDGSLEAHYNAVVQAYVADYALWRPDRDGATLTMHAPATLEAKTYDVITVTPRGGLPFDLWLDRATHLPFRTVVPVGIITTTTTYANYRAFAGLQIATTQKQETVSGVSTLTVSDVRFDGADDASRLERPKSTVADFSIAGGTETSVPIELVDNHVFVDVSINGKGPYRFIFDTGAQLTIDADLAKTLGLGPAGSVQGLGVGTGTDTFNFGAIDSLSIGTARIGRLNTGIAPVRRGFSVASGQPVDGLIGFETLARFVTTFDYGNRRLILRLPGAPSVAGGKTTQFTFNGTDPMVPCRIGDASGTCTVDTGSRSALDVYAPFAKAHPGLVGALTASGIGGFGVGGPSIGKLGRASLSVGGYDVPSIIAGLSEQEKGAFAAPYLAGNIGGAVWRRFAVTFDYPNETITLVPGKEFAAPEQFDRSGMFLISQSGQIVVAGARPGTPAALAGIAPGQALVSIDGHATTEMSLKAIRELFMQPPGSIHTLSMRGKDGALRNVTLKLADYV